MRGLKMGLLDALRDPRFRRDVGTNAGLLAQSMNNTVAEGVSVPVDAIAWALRKGGMNISSAPIGGSDWMAKHGLTKEVPDGLPKLAGETLGLLAPMMGTQQGAAAAARGLRQIGENVAAPAMLNKQAGAVFLSGKSGINKDISLSDFVEIAKQGKKIRTNNSSYPLEKVAKNPYDLGLINNYPEKDIAAFYLAREPYEGGAKEAFNNFLRDKMSTKVKPQAGEFDVSRYFGDF
jgi:hypothetical protein